MQPLSKMQSNSASGRLLIFLTSRHRYSIEVPVLVDFYRYFLISYLEKSTQVIVIYFLRTAASSNNLAASVEVPHPIYSILLMSL